MSGMLGKIPKFTLKFPTALAKSARTMSESPLELSLSLYDDNSYRKVKASEGLRVNLPSEESKLCSKMEDSFEKADEEKSEKEDNMEVMCSVSVDGQEKQEFSLTLYDFDAKDKVNKQDMEKIVVRSICEALGKTLKLPPSGSRTIKVKLAISPDGSKDIDTKELEREQKQVSPAPETPLPCKNQDYDSSKSANTVSTYLMSSGTEKPPSGYARHQCVCTTSPLAANVTLQPTTSPKYRPVRHNRLISLQRQEVKSSLKEHRKKVFEDITPSNSAAHVEGPKPPLEEVHRLNHHFNSRDHVPESRERRNHYLDLAGVENDANHTRSSPQKNFMPSFVDSNYMCPYRILDRTHVCAKSPRNKDLSISPAKKPTSITHPNVNNIGHSETAQACRTQFDTSMQDDFLNLNLDLCDLVPDAKFDWEKIQHRRSKSYDLHTAGAQQYGLYSPKIRPRQAQSSAQMMENYKNANPSPAHHCRVRLRDRERQRAMQQVASWIAKEHAKDKMEYETHFLSGGFAKSPQNSIDKQEHHLHEHIHHHYHHFVDF